MTGSHTHHHFQKDHFQRVVGKKLTIAIVLNTLISVSQTFAGFAAGSLSLLADALHNISDVIALCVSYLASRLSGRKSTLTETYGYRRAEIIAAFINAGLLLGIAVLLVKESVQRFFETPVVDSDLVIIFAALGICFNGLSAALLWKEASQNLNVRSAFLHLLADMMTSVLVFSGAWLMKFWQIFWLDSALCILVALFLVFSSWRVLEETIKIIMHFTPESIDLKELEQEILSHSGVDNIHHVHVWQMNERDIHFEAHVDFVEDVVLSQVTETIKKISDDLRVKFGINHSILQPEIGVADSKQFVVSDCPHI